MVALPLCLKGVGGTPRLGHHMLRDLVVDVPRPPRLLAPPLGGDVHDAQVDPEEVHGFDVQLGLIRPGTVQIETRRSAVCQDSIRSP